MQIATWHLTTKVWKLLFLVLKNAPKVRKLLFLVVKNATKVHRCDLCWETLLELITYAIPVPWKHWFHQFLPDLDVQWPNKRRKIKWGRGRGGYIFENVHLKFDIFVKLIFWSNLIFLSNLTFLSTVDIFVNFWNFGKIWYFCQIWYFDQLLIFMSIIDSFVNFLIKISTGCSTKL